MFVLHMSAMAALLILAVSGIRAMTRHRLPKAAFMVLWCVVLVRLLVPFSIPLPVGVPMPPSGPTVRGRLADNSTNTAAPRAEGTVFVMQQARYPRDGETVPTAQVPAAPITFPLARLWGVGMVVLAVYFLGAHIRGRREYKTAIPLENDFVTQWLRTQKLRRTVQVKSLDRISSPMTFGVWKPVILLPATTHRQDEAGLLHVLTHELAHIKRFDIVVKWLLVAALCIHWFNPLVWVMFFFANRDMELACDEAVLHSLGAHARSAYALTLLRTEELRMGFLPANNFAKNAKKERIEAIMKFKKKSTLGAAVAIVMLAVLAIGTLTVRAQQQPAWEEPPSGVRLEMAPFVVHVPPPQVLEKASSAVPEFSVPPVVYNEMRAAGYSFEDFIGEYAWAEDIFAIRANWEAWKTRQAEQAAYARSAAPVWTEEMHKAAFEDLLAAYEAGLFDRYTTECLVLPFNTMYVPCATCAQFKPTTTTFGSWWLPGTVHPDPWGNITHREWVRTIFNKFDCANCGWVTMWAIGTLSEWRPA